jgi:hypothetical protein
MMILYLKNIRLMIIILYEMKKYLTTYYINNVELMLNYGNSF